MPRLHVIWDRDKLLSHDQLPKDKFKTAVMDIPDDIVPEDISKIVEGLADLLLDSLGNESI